MPVLDDIALKIERAEEHLADLQALGKAWAEAQRIHIVHEHNPESGWHMLRADPLPDPPGKWVVVLGEFAYQLRSALNYTSWAGSSSPTVAALAIRTSSRSTRTLSCGRIQRRRRSPKLRCSCR